MLVIISAFVKLVCSHQTNLKNLNMVSKVNLEVALSEQQIYSTPNCKRHLDECTYYVEPNTSKVGMIYCTSFGGSSDGKRLLQHVYHVLCA